MSIVTEPRPWKIQIQFRKCGAKRRGRRCKACDEGPGHGPYRYRYERINGKMKSFYCGKASPEQAAMKKQELDEKYKKVEQGNGSASSNQ